MFPLTTTLHHVYNDCTLAAKTIGRPLNSITPVRFEKLGLSVIKFEIKQHTKETLDFRILCINS